MDRPSLTFAAGDQTVRWTYGLQMDMQRIIPDAENVINTVMGDPYVRDFLVRRALTDVKKSVEAEDLVKIEDIDLDPDQVLELLNWITGHLLYFFMKSASNLSAQGEQFKAGLPAVTLSELSPAGSAT